MNPLPDIAGGLQRVGLGYVRDDPIAGMRWHITRLYDERGGLHGELEVRRLYPAGPSQGFRLFRGRINLSSSSDRDSKAKYLADMLEGTEAGLDRRWWLRSVGGFCEMVLDAHREGRPFEVIGGPDWHPNGNAAMLVDPLVWAGAPTLLYGPGGSGKSTIAAAIAVSVATGVEVVPGWKVSGPVPVLVLDWEDHGDEWGLQVQAIARGARIEAPTLHYRRMVGSLADNLEEVAAYVCDHEIGFVLIDSVEPASSSESDDYNRKAERLFDAIRELACAALLLDHVTGADLGEGKPILKSIGGVRKRDRARACYELRAEQEPTRERAELVLRDAKRNRRAKQPPCELAIRFTDYDHQGRAHFIAIERCQVTAPDLAEATLSQPDRIRRELAGGAKSAKVLADRTGIAENAVRANLSRMAKRGQVVSFPDQSWGLLR